MNPFSLEGKTILVTGASSGIGKLLTGIISAIFNKWHGFGKSKK